jgi:signal transduction histidine kinase
LDAAPRRRQYGQAVSTPSHSIRRYAFDALIVLGAIAAALEIVLVDDPLRAPETPQWFAVPVAMSIVLLLLGRRRFPFGAPAAFWVAATAVSFVDRRLVVLVVTVFLAGIAAAFLLGTVRDPVEEKIGLAIVLGGAALIVYNEPGHASSNLLLIPALFGIGWAGGFAVRQRTAEADAARERAAHAERERGSAARIAVAEERIRIARELHDIVAHAVSVMVLQVGAVRHNLPAVQTADKKALEAVEQAGRAALTEMRRLLGAMRQDGQQLVLTPQPGLDDLDALVEDVVRAGLPVHVHIEGDAAPLPRALDLSAYRIIQEALTNVLKHAHASEAEVTIDYHPDALEVEVRDDGLGSQFADAVGHGLVGIGERVKIYGGELETENLPSGGFLVRTRLPLRDERS